LRLEITGINHQGEGVARYEGKVYFVPFTVPGDLIEAEPGKQARSYGYARLKSIIRPSPARVESACECMKTCGGCSLQHIDYETQLDLKRGLVADALKRIGNLGEPEILPTLGMDVAYHYRNKAVFHVGTDPVILGFHQSSSHNVVPVGECRLFPQEWGEILSFLEGTLGEAGAPVREIAQVVLRQSHFNGEIMVVLVGKSKPPAGRWWEALAEEITVRFPRVTTIAASDGRDRIIIMSGSGALKERLAGLDFVISPRAFFQVNTVMAEVLVAKVLEYAGFCLDQNVIDAYCGIGTLSLPLAARASRVIGIEQNLAAVRDARQNAAINHINNAEFMNGDSAKVFPRAVSRLNKVDLVVVDPPRKGLSQEVLNAITKLAPDNLIYVSCHPGTLARDLSVLARQGYRIAQVQPVDLFPHTAHVETVCLLERK